MKKTSILTRIFVICTFCIAFTPAHAQYAVIPDLNFGTWLHDNGFSSCMTGDSISGWNIDTTSSSVLQDTSMTLPQSILINSVEGIQYFKGLKYFNCYGNVINIMPILPPALVSFYCNQNNLFALPTLPNSIKYLDCAGNQLGSLPVLPTSLLTINCYGDNLTTLPALPSMLNTLICGNNQLTSLPTLPSSLTFLDCSFNQLSTLSALPPNLTYLDCDDNQIVNLPLLPDSLSYFDCSSNSNLRCLPYLDIVRYLKFDGTSISCLPNVPNGYFSVFPYALPLCDSASGCPYTPLGITNISNEQINLYPNPNKGSFTLRTSASIGSEYTITDMLGHVIIQQSIRSDNEAIELLDAAEGVYTLVIKGAEPIRFVIVR
jgi:hypothetical protein